MATAADINSTADSNVTSIFSDVRIDGDWDLSTVGWVVFVAVLCSIVLAAMFVALVARYRNQRDQEDDWEEVPREARRNTLKHSVGSEMVRPLAHNSQHTLASTANGGAQHGNSQANVGGGSQSSITPIVVSNNDSTVLSPGNIATLSASVPAINASSRASSTTALHGGQPRRLSELASMDPAGRLRVNSASDSQRAPSPIIWDQGTGSQMSRVSDPIYGYSRLAGRANSQSEANRETREYDDVVQAQMRSHTVTTPRQSRHYDMAA